MLWRKHLYWSNARLSLVCLLLALALPPRLAGASVALQVDPGPGDPGPCAVASQVGQIGDDLRVYIYYPGSSECGAGLAAPYPGIAIAHGFSMFGLINMALGHEGDAEHLASWGYVVAVPVLPDDAEGRAGDIQDVLSVLEIETQTPDSFLYQMVDADRLALVGHSFGGATVLAVAARDSRVKAVLSMDPVYHQGGPFSGEEPAFWDPEAEGPRIQAPTCILGAPASNCNSEADYEEIYPVVGAAHKASLFIVGASHCDFMDPGYGACSLVCEGDTDPARTQLAQKYTTAWLNYYLHSDVRSYEYVYGGEAEADVAAGRIDAQWDAAPKGVTGQIVAGAASLQWELYEHPMVAGYNIYRRLPEQSYTATPHAQVGRVANYLDEGLAAGQAYCYAVRSHDPAGNEHPAADEVCIGAQDDITPSPTAQTSATPTATPTVRATPTHTAAASATATHMATASPTLANTPAPTPSPTRTPETGLCRLYLPAVLLGVAGARAVLARQPGSIRRP